MRLTSDLSRLVHSASIRTPDATAVWSESESLSYEKLDARVIAFAGALINAGVHAGDRVVIYAHKCNEAVIAIFGAARAGCIFVPVNPLLKTRQLAHLLADCTPRIVVTNRALLANAKAGLADAHCDALRICISSDDTDTIDFLDFTNSPQHWPDPAAPRSDDRAAILYTSGSTGQPKGVLLSHENLLTGAESVASYLEIEPRDRILAALPLSFDAGLSQLTTAFHSGATAYLHNYLLSQDLIRAILRHAITGVTGVPSIWIQLVAQRSMEPAATVRHFANTGGRLPGATLDRLRKLFPNAKPFLMYGFTEAFRSTYLPPEEIDRRPGSVGKAIPGAQVFLADEHGRPAAPGQAGELVHRGPLVAMGYWNNPAATEGKFRPLESLVPAAHPGETGAWSGDMMRTDEDGYLYFVGRNDAMIKTSGYRVSPDEIEQLVTESGLCRMSVVFGIPDENRGQAIVLVIAPTNPGSDPRESLRELLLTELPGYMQPDRIELVAEIPLTPNGKPDRSSLQMLYGGN